MLRGAALRGCSDLVLSYNVSLGLTRNLLDAMGDLHSSTILTMLRNATSAPPPLPQNMLPLACAASLAPTLICNGFHATHRWTVSNLCRGKPPPRWGLVADLLQPLVTLIHHTDEEVCAMARHGAALHAS